MIHRERKQRNREIENTMDENKSIQNMREKKIKFKLCLLHVEHVLVLHSAVRTNDVYVSRLVSMLIFSQQLTTQQTQNENKTKQMHCITKNKFPSSSER